MAIEDIVMDLLVAVVAVIIGAYILNILGYLTHKSPVNLFSGESPTTQLMREAGTGGSSQGLERERSSNEPFGQTALPPGSAGANEGAFGRGAVV